MVFGLSTTHEIGLATMGALFVTFSLLSSFVFPRLNPNFPGKKGLRWYLPLCGLFFIAMMSSVLYFGREQKVAEATPPPTTSGPPANAAAIAAGKTLFASSGCAACHTFTPAGATGKVGPNLDFVKDYANKAGQPLEDFLTESITHPPPKYVPPGFPSNVMQPDGGAHLSTADVANLVAFLQTGP
jgi:mono/diheme cytochrome c family protein